jgi:alpha-N-arabinofuranosidase
MIVRSSLSFIFLTFTDAALLPLNAQQTADIVVNASQKLGPVNPLVFGQNINAADNAHIFSSETTDLNLIQRGDGFWDPDKGAPVSEVVNQSRAVKMSMLRYPGGCLAHNFDWRKTVGPAAKENGWLFGVDEYLRLCHTIGAIPLITISDYALPADQMPANAAALVEYLNSPADTTHPWAMKRKDWGHPAPYRATWFELGNESMHGNHRVLPRRQYLAEQYAAYANATAAAMRKIDPGIKLGIVVMPGPGTDVNCDWNRTVVRLAGAGADFVVIHMYTPEVPKAGLPENVLMQTMMAAGQQVEEHLIEYHQMIRKELGHDLPLAITEFNGALDQSAYRLSYGNALECADLLRVFLKPEMNVALANYWTFLNSPFGMLHTTVHASDGEPVSREPALLLYELWSRHFGSQLLKVEAQTPRAEFSGAGSIEAARGTASEPRRQIQRFDLDQYSSLTGTLWPRLLNVQIQRTNSDVTIHLQNLNRSIYPLLAEIPRPDVAPGTQVEFSVSFDAKFTPDPGSDTAPMGIGLMDSRGWNQTRSGIGVDDITTDWKHLDGTYRLTPQTPNVDLTARLIAGGKTVSGTLLVRNLMVADYITAHDAAYPLLTTSASVSSDGRKVYLIVFNKSASDSIPTTIHLTGFSADSAQYWEVNGAALNSAAGVSETRQREALPMHNASATSHIFPAHSMTAIEFSRGS